MKASPTHQGSSATINHAPSENLSDESITHLLQAGGCLEWLSFAAAMSQCLPELPHGIFNGVFQRLVDGLRMASFPHSFTYRVLSELRANVKRFNGRLTDDWAEHVSDIWFQRTEWRSEDDILSLLRDSGIDEFAEGVAEIKQELVDNVSSASSRVLNFACWLYSDRTFPNNWSTVTKGVLLRGFVQKDFGTPFELSPELAPWAKLPELMASGERPVSRDEMGLAVQHSVGEVKSPQRRPTPWESQSSVLPDFRIVFSQIERVIEDTTPVETDFAEDCLAFLASEYEGTGFSRSVSELRVEDFLGKPRNVVIDWLGRWLALLGSSERCASLLREFRGSVGFEDIQVVERDGQHFIYRMGFDQEVPLMPGDRPVFEKLLEAEGEIVSMGGLLGRSDEDRDYIRDHRNHIEKKLTNLRRSLPILRVELVTEHKKGWRLERH